MHFYSIGYVALLSLPIITFWELARNVDRIRAEEDRRFFIAVSNVMGGKADDYLKSLEREQGTVFESETQFDKAGFDNLKRLVGRG